MFSTAHLHPMIVHFPVAIITIGFLADLFSLFIRKEKCLSTMGFYLEIIGALAAIAAYLTGYFFTGALEGEAGIMRERHETFALLTMITITVATCFRVYIILRKKEESYLKFIALGIFFLAFVFVSVTGYLGGSLVLDYLIGI